METLRAHASSDGRGGSYSVTDPQIKRVVTFDSSWVEMTDEEYRKKISHDRLDHTYVTVGPNGANVYNADEKNLIVVLWCGGSGGF